MDAAETRIHVIKGTPQAQGQAIQWPKEKGQSLIYKTLHRKLSFPPQRYIFSQETKIRFLFFGHKKNHLIPSRPVFAPFP
jgi:hypothetical protein